MYDWQQTTWQQLTESRDRLPHALLFHGQAGIGKTAFAHQLGEALLCDTPNTQGLACGTCPSCLWIRLGNHPDFRVVRPEVLEAADLQDKEGESDAEPVAKGKRAPSKEIRIEQIRQLNDQLNIASHRGGQRVVLIYPAQAMNVFTANALLKVLEEPPANTTFLLVADQIERLLPTILSRCRKVAMPLPAQAEALNWLNAQQVPDAEQLLAEYSGAPLAAFESFKDDSSSAALRRQLIEQLGDPQKINVVILAEQLGKCELTMVLGWIQRWVFDCVSYRLANRVRYYPKQLKQIALLAKSFDLISVLNYAKQIDQERRVAEHPLNTKLYVENLLFAYVDAINGTLK